jgi:virginiamycin B lyase
MNRSASLLATCLLLLSQGLEAQQPLPPPPTMPQPPGFPTPGGPIPGMPTQPGMPPQRGMPTMQRPLGVPGNAPLPPGAAPIRTTEWPLPSSSPAGGLWVGLDGNLYLSEPGASRVVRFDTKGRAFQDWPLPAPARPAGAMADSHGMVWYAGSGNATIGRVNPANGQVSEYRIPTGAAPHALAIDSRGNVWFTLPDARQLGRLDAATGIITDYSTLARPGDTLVADRVGRVWVTEPTADRLDRVDATSGKITPFPLGPGSRPQQIAISPDGTILWVVLSGTARLAAVDAGSGQILRDYPLTAAAQGVPGGLAVDNGGNVWLGDIFGRTLIRIDRLNGVPNRLNLSGFSNPGFRQLVVDPDGHVWYLSGDFSRVGLIE